MLFPEKDEIEKVRKTIIINGIKRFTKIVGQSAYKESPSTVE